MPQFGANEVKTAIVPVTVSPAGVSCEIELFLGLNESNAVASSGLVPFVSTGSAKQVSLPLMMPDNPGVYHVYIDVLTGGEVFLAYMADEDIEITTPDLVFGTPVVTVVPNKMASQFYVAQVVCTVSNPTQSAITRTIKCGCRKADEPWKIWYRRWPDLSLELAVTLSPGETRTLVSPYYYTYQGEESANPPLLLAGYHFYYWMESQTGKSPETYE
jgi:hypothetical protein